MLAPGTLRLVRVRSATLRWGAIVRAVPPPPFNGQSNMPTIRQFAFVAPAARRCCLRAPATATVAPRSDYRVPWLHGSIGEAAKPPLRVEHIKHITRIF